MSRRTWILQDLAQRCARCQADIPACTWYVEIRLPNRKRVEVCCEQCAKTDEMPVPSWTKRAGNEVM
jgi:hypothetical protein